jgi:hypothetical protein
VFASEGLLIPNTEPGLPDVLKLMLFADVEETGREPGIGATAQ